METIARSVFDRFPLVKSVYVEKPYITYVLIIAAYIPHESCLDRPCLDAR